MSSASEKDGGWSPGTAMRSCIERAGRLLAPGSQEWLNFLPPDRFPRFFSHGRGPFLFDVDGRRYTDLYCASGALILGHGDPVQAEALADRSSFGATVSFRSTLEIELASWFRERLPFAERTVFFKTGS